MTPNFGPKVKWFFNIQKTLRIFFRLLRTFFGVASADKRFFRFFKQKNRKRFDLKPKISKFVTYKN